MLREKSRLATAVVTCNKAAEARLREVLGEPASAKVRLIHHGLDRSALPRRKEEGDYLLAAGRLEPKKGFDLLVRACAILKQRAVIAGEGSEREALEKLIAAESAPVELRGWVRHDELIALLAGAKAVVVPSVVDAEGDRDGIPNIVLEAMAVGVPVIATDAGGIAEAVKDGETGWLAAQATAKGLAAKVKEALSDPRRADIIARAGALIEKDFSLDRSIPDLEGILRTGDV